MKAQKIPSRARREEGVLLFMALTGYEFSHSAPRSCSQNKGSGEEEGEGEEDGGVIPHLGKHRSSQVFPWTFSRFD